MQKRNTLEKDMHRVLVNSDGSNTDGQEPEQGIPSIDEPAPLQDIYVYIVREHDEEPDQPDDAGVIETTLAPQKSSLRALIPFVFALLLTGSSIALQLSLAFHPFIATITILPKSQQVTLSETLQLGRLLHPVTLSESQTVNTTGTGHQDAREAHGFITFYNGEFTSVTVSAGTVLTGADGVQIVTDQDATIPAANPPVFGHVTLSAHAAQPGRKGNIPAYDISHACCAPSVLAKNSSSFSGGQDERNFQAVAQADIENAASTLKTTLAARSNGALQGQLQPGEQVATLPCSPTVSPDHQVGAEAIRVTVIVSETCRAVAYSSTELQRKALLLLSSQVMRTGGAGYHPAGKYTVVVQKAILRGATPPSCSQASVPGSMDSLRRSRGS
jgi:Baseplate J-like protein